VCNYSSCILKKSKTKRITPVVRNTNIYSLKIHLWLRSTNMVTEIHMTYTYVSRILRFNYALFPNSAAKYVCLKSNSLTYNTKQVYCKTAVLLSNCHDFPQLSVHEKYWKIEMFHQSSSKETPLLACNTKCSSIQTNLRNVTGFYVQMPNNP